MRFIRHYKERTTFQRDSWIFFSFVEDVCIFTGLIKAIKEKTNKKFSLSFSLFISLFLSFNRNLLLRLLRYVKLRKRGCKLVWLSVIPKAESTRAGTYTQVVGIAGALSGRSALTRSSRKHEQVGLTTRPDVNYTLFANRCYASRGHRWKHKNEPLVGNVSKLESRISLEF